MQLLTGYAAVLIVVGQVLAVLGVILVIYFTIRQRLQERVRSGKKPGKKPGRRGLPYPDLYHWHILQQRHPLGRRVRQVFVKEKTPGI